MHKRNLLFACALTVSLSSGAAHATVYHFESVFNFLQNLSANENGQTAGVSNFLGAVCAAPVGSACNSFNDHSETIATATQGATVRSLAQFPLTVAPNFWATSVPIDPADASTFLTGAWTLNFSNGDDDSPVVTPVRGETTPMPFVHSVTITTATNPNGVIEPTLSWSLPSLPQGVSANVVRINVFDLDNAVSGNQADVIFTRTIDSSHTCNDSPATCFTITEADLVLERDHRYEFEVSIAQTRDGTSNGVNENLLNRSRSFFSFTLPAEGDPAIHLPTVDPDGGPDGQPVYHFDIREIAAGEVIFIDPIVAIGYDYQIGAGDPNFASVSLPDVGDGVYRLWLFDDTDTPFDSGFDLFAGTEFEFLATIDLEGIDKFRILGIETSAGLDPNNPLAFVTGLSFVEDGSFTGTMTPLVAEVAEVPVPAGWTLLLVSFGGLLLTYRRAARRSNPESRPALMGLQLRGMLNLTNRLTPLCLAVPLLLSVQPSLAAPLKKEEVTKLYAGNTVAGKTEKGDAYRIYHLPDGEQVLNLKSGWSDRGRWRVSETGQLCSKWQKIRNGAEICGSIELLADDRIRWTGSDGTVNEAQWLKGNQADRF